MNSEIQSYEPDKNDAFSRILRFYMHADVMLSAEEDIILKRWVHADKLILQRKFTTLQIIEKLVELFSVSRYTAQNDIRLTHALFSQTRAMSKQYILSHHIEDIQLTIEKYKLDKSLAHLVPKLYDALTKALALLSEEVSKEKTPVPTVYIGTMNVNSEDADDKISFEDAKARWEQKKQKRSQTDYTDFEDVK
jgi:hypothetical protein